MEKVKVERHRRRKFNDDAQDQEKEHGKKRKWRHKEIKCNGLKCSRER